MTLSLLAAVVMIPQTKFDPSYMVQAVYPVGSLQKDPLEPGGHSESNNMPKMMVSKSRLQKTLGVELSANKTGLSVRIFNASQDSEWLRAMDGNLTGWLEALDGKD